MDVVAARYEIVVAGRPGAMVAAAMEGFVVDVPEPGLIRCIGAVADQAALQGVLQRLADLRLELVDVHRLPVGDRTAEGPGAVG